MKEIKTLWYRADDNEDFDNVLNNWLNKGFKLCQFNVCKPKTQGKTTMLFALLEKDDELAEKEQPAEPANQLTPCERDGHNFISLYYNKDYLRARCYCSKCGKGKTIDIG